MHMKDKNQQYSCDYCSSDGVCPLPINSTTAALKLLIATIYFIVCCLKALKHNFI